MANVFDFELHADENATKALAEIEARIKALQPILNSTREGLRFGGSETLENTGALSAFLFVHMCVHLLPDGL
ncbi:hypothetical protein [Xenorhabdus bovienii]|uniref:hypothetical protein n=1 Tax=Xenorhabdus bovienii TaxID=40576 RepID=UPI003DA1D5B4